LDIYKDKYALSKPDCNAFNYRYMDRNSADSDLHADSNRNLVHGPIRHGYGYCGKLGYCHMDIFFHFYRYSDKYHDEHAGKHGDGYTGKYFHIYLHGFTKCYPYTLAYQYASTADSNAYPDYGAYA
jgi:hypothetical protein